MVMDKIALALLIVGAMASSDRRDYGAADRRRAELGLYRAVSVRFGGLCLWRFGQPDQPDHLYSRRPVSGMVYLSALPGHDGPAHLTRRGRDD